MRTAEARDQLRQHGSERHHQNASPAPASDELRQQDSELHGLAQARPVGNQEARPKRGQAIAGGDDLIRAGCPPDERDNQALAALPAALFLSDRQLRSQLRRLLSCGKEIPAHIWAEVDSALATRPREEAWYGAIAVLAASEPHQDKAVAIMAESVREHRDPSHALYLLSGCIGEVGSPFTGRGWGRDQLGRKLLPLARVLLARGVWPTDTWLRCLTPDNEEPQTTLEARLERGYERVKAILGEALFERALDTGEALEFRRKAVRAIGCLSPKNDASHLIRALGKLRSDPALAAEVTGAQREHRDRARNVRLDAETCIMDAWEIFTGPSLQAVASRER